MLDGEPLRTVALSFSTFGRLNSTVVRETIPKLNRPSTDAVESVRGGTGTSLLRTLRTMEAIGRRKKPTGDHTRQFAEVTGVIEQEIDGETYGTFTNTLHFPALGNYLP